MDITIIMPALNEEQNIGRALERSLRAFTEYGLTGEVVVINDGSSDRTAKVVEERMAHNEGRSIRMLNHKKPRGIGASFRDGLAQARGEAVTMMPGDDENDPSEILKYFGLLEKVDMVVPFVSNREVRPWCRNVISELYRFIINITFRVGFKYTNGTVLYRRGILAANKSNGFFFQTENVIRAAKKGYLFAEVPYKLDVRGGGASKAISPRSLNQVIKDYLNLVKDIYFQGSRNL